MAHENIHMNPAEAVEAHVDLAARQSIAMHFGTFRLTPEAIDARCANWRAPCGRAASRRNSFGPWMSANRCGSHEIGEQCHAGETGVLRCSGGGGFVASRSS